MIRKGLGKGLGALITDVENLGAGVREIKINEIEPNTNQPRKNFDNEKLKQLAESIKQHGVVQPIIIKRENGAYKIVAGERRWRASRIAGLATVPVIIRELTNRQLMEIALVENLQREDLNPLEEAEAYDRLMKEYKMTQEEISVTVGKSRSAIANSVRLLGLNELIKGYLISGQLTSGHARAILSVDETKLQEKIADEVIKNDLNVRDTEKLVKRYPIKKLIRKKEKNIEIADIEDKLKNYFSTKVKIVHNNKRGKIMIEYYSNDELERILELFKI